MSVGIKTCEEICNRSTCNYMGDTDTECFAKLPEVILPCLLTCDCHKIMFDAQNCSYPMHSGSMFGIRVLSIRLVKRAAQRQRRRLQCFLQVQKRLNKLFATSPTKLLAGESSTPFSKDYVWAKTKLLGKGAFGSVYR